MRALIPDVASLILATYLFNCQRAGRKPAFPRRVPQLRGKFILPDCGHWTQQERASEVNAAMIDFLREL
jgi:pimeloyl-ACP methyl ester carboxylesterase